MEAIRVPLLLTEQTNATVTQNQSELGWSSCLLRLINKYHELPHSLSD
jgi:hypothetical protein